MWIRKLVFCFLFFVACFLSLVTPAHADEKDFSTAYDVSYDVSADGSTLVTEKITLKNLTSQYYVSNFSLSIGSTTVYDVVASDDQGAMEVKTESNDQRTSIGIKFNQQVAGLGKTQSFTLKFKSKDFAQSLGKTWEVNLPKIPSSSNISSYNLTLSVPVSFGDPTSISPKPKNETQSFDKIFFTFDKSQLEKSGVSVNFGTTQFFDFSIKYPLENKSLFPIMTSITLPPDTAYQDIAISKIIPEPENVTIDSDGNYLAWYRLPRGVKLEVAVVGEAKLYIKPKEKGRVIYSGDKLKTLTQADTYWEKDSPSIQQALKEILQNEEPKTNTEKAKLVYQYTVNTLKYNTKRLNDNDIQRLGAVTALNNSSEAVCMEFTDLFIALARAAGVPARELDGFAYTQNSTLRPLSLSRDLLHAWPEYYDPDLGWIMVDPTWENTSGGVDYFNKFDLNHLVLAIRGVSSEYPSTSDDVKVSLSSNEFKPDSKLEVNIESGSSLWSGFPVNLSVKVRNLGPSIEAPSELILSTKNLTVQGTNVNQLDSIPPFGNQVYQYNLRAPLIWEPIEESIEVMVAGQRTTKKVMIKPFFQTKEVQIVGAALGLILIGIYGGTLGLHWYHKRKAKV